MDEKCQKKVNRSENQSHPGFITGSIPVFTPVSPHLQHFPLYIEKLSTNSDKIIFFGYLTNEIFSKKYQTHNFESSKIFMLEFLNQNIIFDS